MLATAFRFPRQTSKRRTEIVLICLLTAERRDFAHWGKGLFLRFHRIPIRTLVSALSAFGHHAGEYITGCIAGQCGHDGSQDHGQPGFQTATER